MLNIFLIATEHHMIQIEQTIKYYNLKSQDNLFWFMLVGNSNWIERALNRFKIQDFIISESWNFQEVLIRSLKAKKYIQELKRVANTNRGLTLYYSQYSSDFSLLAISFLNPKEIVLMDEGTASFGVCRKRKSLFDIDVFKLCIKSFFYKKFIRYPNRITFFTQYDINIPIRDKLYKYNFLKINNEELQFSENEFALLGSSMVEVELLKEDYYLSLIEKIRNLHLGKNIKYFCHRKENNNKLIKIKDLGFEIIKNNIPFEFFFEKVEVCPAIIGSFFSPVLLNLELKFQKLPELEIYEFDLDNLLFNKAVIKEIINNYRKNNRIKIIKL